MHVLRRLSIIAALVCFGCNGMLRGAVPERDGAPLERDAAVLPGVDAWIGGDAARPDYPAGVPGCGLPLAAFCDTFDDVAPAGLGEGRAGDLHPRFWSAARMRHPYNVGAEAVPVPLATVPACRPGVPARVYPGQDVLVCDGNDLINSRHLLVAAAEQNYGQASLRIRQPFDFHDRTGTIAFDVSPGAVSFLLGWPSIAITEDPSPAPSFGVQQNLENAAIPRAGLEVHFYHLCGAEDRVGVSVVSVFNRYEEHFYAAGGGGREHPCVHMRPGALNHFEVRLSRSHVEVWGTDESADGVAFGELQLMFALDVELPFDRGYVHLNTHNHATFKYSEGHTTDSWVTRWDNVGFDGPVVDDQREYSIADSMTPIRASFDDVGELDCRNVGYPIGAAATGPSQTHTFHGVEAAGVDRAGIALNAHLPVRQGLPYEGYTLHYRLNGGAWQDRRFTPEELTLVQTTIVLAEGTGTTVRGPETTGGAMSFFLELDPTALREGDNTLELTTEGVPRNVTPTAVNMDLVLHTQ